MFSTQCPNCGLARNEWLMNKGEGYEINGAAYCCRGCAEEIGCACRESTRLRQRRMHFVHRHQ